MDLIAATSTQTDASLLPPSLSALPSNSSSSSRSRSSLAAAAAATADAAAPALLKIERTAIAAATQLSFDPKELLLLMYEHLKACGLHGSAGVLAKEAGLSGRAQQQIAAAAGLEGQQYGVKVEGGSWGGWGGGVRGGGWLLGGCQGLLGAKVYWWFRKGVQEAGLSRRGQQRIAAGMGLEAK